MIMSDSSDLLEAGDGGSVESHALAEGSVSSFVLMAKLFGNLGYSVNPQSLTNLTLCLSIAGKGHRLLFYLVQPY